MSPRRPQTLRGRLILAAVGSIVAAVVLFGVAAVLLVRHELRSSLDSALSQRAQEVAELAVSAPAVLHYPGALESPVSGPQIAVVVVDAHGRVLASSPALDGRPLSQVRVALAARISGQTAFQDIELDGHPYRLYAAPIADAGPAADGAVLVASDTTDIGQTTSRLEVVLILSGAAIALIAGLIAVGLTRRGLRPLRRLVAGAGEIERTADASRRLPEGGAEDEIGQLTGVLNRMLASLEAARAGERRFLADASHELRTPVTTLRGNVEFAARHGVDDEVLAELERDATRLARLVDDLLVLERADASAIDDAGPIDLADVVREVLGRRQGTDGRVAVGDVEPSVVRGNADALARALENLVENAVVHGPEGAEVTIGLTHSHDHALLTVRDEGPGPDPSDRDRLFERFWRGAGASARPGSGLGLSIVSAIVARHGGEIHVEGSAFTIELPLLNE